MLNQDPFKTEIKALSTNTTPSFDSLNTSFTWNQSTGNGSHNAEWTGGDPNFTLEIKKVGETFPFYTQTGIASQSDSDSGYATGTTFNGSEEVEFKVTDTDGDFDTIQKVAAVIS